MTDDKILEELEKMGAIEKVSFDSETQLTNQYMKNTTGCEVSELNPHGVPISWLQVYECGFTGTIGHRVKIKSLSSTGNTSGSVYLEKQSDHTYGHFNCYNSWSGKRKCASVSDFIVGQEYEVKHLWKDGSVGGTFAWLEHIQPSQLPNGPIYPSIDSIIIDKKFAADYWFKTYYKNSITKPNSEKFDVLNDIVTSWPEEITVKKSPPTIVNIDSETNYSNYFHPPTCSSIGLSASDMSFNGYIPKTQKVRGLQALATAYSSNNLTNPISVVKPEWVFKASEELPEDLSFYFPKFARPCPLTPRHGFVDSRVVNNKTELKKVIEETFDADPDGEVMIMPFIPSLLNMVWTPALLTIGPGHDGATAGKGSTSFPLNGKYDSRIKSILAKASIDDYPYVEAVTRDPGTIKSGGSLLGKNLIPLLTQLRNGPVLDSKPDYIPKKVVVTKVIKPDVEGGDLLAWEDKMLSFKGVPGVVVYHPTGSQADHFAIHARSCKIPCVVTFKPSVGDVLEPIPTTPPSYSAVISGLVAGSRVEFGKFVDHYGVIGWAQEADSMLLGLHNMPAMEGEQAWWFGAAISILLRLGSMALRGEARHLRSVHGTRHVVYGKCANTKLQAHAKSCNSLINIFKYGWKPGKGGFGGTAWAQCGLALGDVFNSVRDFIVHQDDDTFGALIRSFNTAINQAHNGGWWMNKFTSKERFNQAQNGDLKIILESAPFMWELAKVHHSLNQEKTNHAIRNWGKWTTVDLTPPKTKSVKLDYVPGSSWVTILINDSVLREKRLPFSLNLKNIFKRIPPGWERDFIIRETPNGIAVDVVFPGIIDEPLNIWKEPKINVQSVND